MTAYVIVLREGPVEDAAEKAQYTAKCPKILLNLL